jgi:hypothetical protein
MRLLGRIVVCLRRVEVPLRFMYQLILVALTSSVLVKVHDGVLITLRLLILLWVVLYGVILVEEFLSSGCVLRVSHRWCLLISILPV